MPPIPLMILAGFDPILPAAAGPPGVTVMPPVPAAATSASEHEEEEQSPKDQPDQPSSHQHPHPLSGFRLTDELLSHKKGCISRASSHPHDI